MTRLGQGVGFCVSVTAARACDVHQILLVFVVLVVTSGQISEIHMAIRIVISHSTRAPFKHLFHTCSSVHLFLAAPFLLLTSIVSRLQVEPGAFPQHVYLVPKINQHTQKPKEERGEMR